MMQTITKPGAIWAKLLELPPDRQQQVLDFIEFLHSYKPKISEDSKAREIMFEDDEMLLEAIEDEGIYRSMLAVQDETPLDLESAKLMVAIAYFQQHKLSLGKAAELAGISRLEFMDILADRGITIFDYDESEFDLELDVINHWPGDKDDRQ